MRPKELFCAAFLAGSWFASSAVAKNLVKQPAPQFSLPTLAGGSVSLAEHKGRVVVVDFWAEWCEPCRQELPELDKLAQKFGAEVAVIAINMDQKRSNAEKLAKKLGLRFTVALDPNGTVAEKYDLEKMPSTFVIDKNGIIVVAESGYDGPADTKALENQIQKLLLDKK